MIYFLCLAAGIFLGTFALWIYQRIKLSTTKNLAAELLQKAQQEADHAAHASEFAIKQKEFDHQRKLEDAWQTERRKIRQEEERLAQREEKLETRWHQIEKKEISLATGKQELEEEKKELHKIKERFISELEKVSSLSSAEAKEMLLNRISEEIKSDTAHFIRKMKKEAEENAEHQAATILATAMNRLAVPCVSEITICTVPIQNEEIKGRIIGREGRNIRALERATGVNLIIDDTPGVVVISGYDPIRKQIAKLALTELLNDGRIHPTRIEEVVEKATTQVQKQIKHYGEDAALRIGAINIHPEMTIFLGKLKFRYSYGQNVLDHSLEVANLMGLMAAELGLNIRLAKRIGLLHDIGKAVSHEIEGSHAIIGHDLALKYGETKEVANGIGCHHGEIEAITLEGRFCATADAISASRPGARIEAVEEYIKRLKALEDIAFEFPGVEKAYALQAGREILVTVLPDMIDDDGVTNLARDLTKRIEQELRYPGKIKVTVIREKRIVEYAL
jgi:ribonuclease Y